MRKLQLLGVAALTGLSTLAAQGPARPQSNDVAPAMNDAIPARNADGASPVAVGPEPTAEPARAGNPLREIPMSKLWVTRDRPLFSSSRRPPPPRVVAVPPPPATAEPVAPAAPPFTLVGTIIGENDRIGIFFNETSKITTRIRLGDVDSGWTLRSIDARSVLEGNRRMVTLDLPEPSVPADPGPRVSGILNVPRDNDGGL
jgi:general secretion pathway protein N